MKIIELFESEEDIITLIKRDCQPFIQAHPSSLMYRGMKNKSGAGYGEDEFFKQRVRQDRQPMSIRDRLHPLIDNWFEQEFGFKARSQTVFVSGDFMMAQNYGKVYAVFPIGDFKFVWSRDIHDLFGNISAMTSESEIADKMKALNYRDTNFKAAVASDHEIMIHCKEYYAVAVRSPRTDGLDLYQKILESGK